MMSSSNGQNKAVHISQERRATIRSQPSASSSVPGSPIAVDGGLAYVRVRKEDEERVEGGDAPISSVVNLDIPVRKRFPVLEKKASLQMVQASISRERSLLRQGSLSSPRSGYASHSTPASPSRAEPDQAALSPSHSQQGKEPWEAPADSLVFSGQLPWHLRNWVQGEWERLRGDGQHHPIQRSSQPPSVQFQPDREVSVLGEFSSRPDDQWTGKDDQYNTGTGRKADIEILGTGDSDEDDDVDGPGVDYDFGRDSENEPLNKKGKSAVFAVGGRGITGMKGTRSAVEASLSTKHEQKVNSLTSHNPWVEVPKFRMFWFFLVVVLIGIAWAWPVLEGYKRDTIKLESARATEIKIEPILFQSVTPLSIPTDECLIRIVNKCPGDAEGCSDQILNGLFDKTFEESGSDGTCSGCFTRVPGARRFHLSPRMTLSNLILESFFNELVCDIVLVVEPDHTVHIEADKASIVAEDVQLKSLTVKGLKGASRSLTVSTTRLTIQEELSIDASEGGVMLDNLKLGEDASVHVGMRDGSIDITTTHIPDLKVFSTNRAVCLVGDFDSGLSSTHHQQGNITTWSYANCADPPCSGSRRKMNLSSSGIGAIGFHQLSEGLNSPGEPAVISEDSGGGRWEPAVTDGGVIFSGGGFQGNSFAATNQRVQDSLSQLAFVDLHGPGLMRGGVQLVWARDRIWFSYPTLWIFWALSMGVVSPERPMQFQATVGFCPAHGRFMDKDMFPPIQKLAAELQAPLEENVDGEPGGADANTKRGAFIMRNMGSIRDRLQPTDGAHQGVPSCAYCDITRLGKKEYYKGGALDKTINDELREQCDSRVLDARIREAECSEPAACNLKRTANRFAMVEIGDAVCFENWAVAATLRNDVVFSDDNPYCWTSADVGPYSPLSTAFFGWSDCKDISNHFHIPLADILSILSLVIGLCTSALVSWIFFGFFYPMRKAEAMAALLTHYEASINHVSKTVKWSRYFCVSRHYSELPRESVTSIPSTLSERDEVLNAEVIAIDHVSQRSRYPSWSPWKPWRMSLQGKHKKFQAMTVRDMVSQDLIYKLFWLSNLEVTSAREEKDEHETKKWRFEKIEKIYSLLSDSTDTKEGGLIKHFGRVPLTHNHDGAEASTDSDEESSGILSQIQKAFGCLFLPVTLPLKWGFRWFAWLTLEPPVPSFVKALGLDGKVRVSFVRPIDHASAVKSNMNGMGSRLGADAEDSELVNFFTPPLLQHKDTIDKGEWKNELSENLLFTGKGAGKGPGPNEMDMKKTFEEFQKDVRLSLFILRNLQRTVGWFYLMELPFAHLEPPQIINKDLAKRADEHPFYRLALRSFWATCHSLFPELEVITMQICFCLLPTAAFAIFAVSVFTVRLVEYGTTEYDGDADGRWIQSWLFGTMILLAGMNIFSAVWYHWQEKDWELRDAVLPSSGGVYGWSKRKFYGVRCWVIEHGKSVFKRFWCSTDYVQTVKAKNAEVQKVSVQDRLQEAFGKQEKRLERLKSPEQVRHDFSTKFAFDQAQAKLHHVVVVISIFLTLLYVFVAVVWIVLGMFLNPNRVGPFFAAVLGFFYHITSYYRSLLDFLQDMQIQLKEMMIEFRQSLQEELLGKAAGFMEEMEHKMKSGMEAWDIHAPSVATLQNLSAAASTRNVDLDDAVLIPPFAKNILSQVADGRMKRKDIPKRVSEEMQSLIMTKLNETGYINNLRESVQLSAMSNASQSEDFDQARIDRLSIYVIEEMEAQGLSAAGQLLAETPGDSHKKDREKNVNSIKHTIKDSVETIVRNVLVPSGLAGPESMRALLKERLEKVFLEVMEELGEGWEKQVPLLHTLWANVKKIRNEDPGQKSAISGLKKGAATSLLNEIERGIAEHLQNEINNTGLLDQFLILAQIGASRTEPLQQRQRAVLVTYYDCVIDDLEHNLIDDCLRTLQQVEPPKEAEQIQKAIDEILSKLQTSKAEHIPDLIWDKGTTSEQKTNKDTSSKGFEWQTLVTTLAEPQKVKAFAETHGTEIRQIANFWGMFGLTDTNARDISNALDTAKEIVSQMSIGKSITGEKTLSAGSAQSGWKKLVDDLQNMQKSSKTTETQHELQRKRPEILELSRILVLSIQKWLGDKYGLVLEPSPMTAPPAKGLRNLSLVSTISRILMQVLAEKVESLAKPDGSKWETLPRDVTKAFEERLRSDTEKANVAKSIMKAVLLPLLLQGSCKDMPSDASLRKLDLDLRKRIDKRFEAPDSNSLQNSNDQSIIPLDWQKDFDGKLRTAKLDFVLEMMAGQDAMKQAADRAIGGNPSAHRSFVAEQSRRRLLRALHTWTKDVFKSHLQKRVNYHLHQTLDEWVKHALAPANIRSDFLARIDMTVNSIRDGFSASGMPFPQTLRLDLRTALQELIESAFEGRLDSNGQICDLLGVSNRLRDTVQHVVKDPQNSSAVKSGSQTGQEAVDQTQPSEFKRLIWASNLLAILGALKRDFEHRGWTEKLLHKLGSDKEVWRADASEIEQIVEFGAAFQSRWEAMRLALAQMVEEQHSDTNAGQREMGVLLSGSRPSQDGQQGTTANTPNAQTEQAEEQQSETFSHLRELLQPVAPADAASRALFEKEGIVFEIDKTLKFIHLSFRAERVDGDGGDGKSQLVLKKYSVVGREGEREGGSETTGFSRFLKRKNDPWRIWPTGKESLETWERAKRLGQTLEQAIEDVQEYIKGIQWIDGKLGHDSNSDFAHFCNAAFTKKESFRALKPHLTETIKAKTDELVRALSEGKCVELNSKLNRKLNRKLNANGPALTAELTVQPLFEDTFQEALSLWQIAVRKPEFVNGAVAKCLYKKVNDILNMGLVGTMVEKITGDAIGLAPSFTEKTKLKARASAMTKDVTDLDVLLVLQKMGLSRPQIVLLVAWSALILAAVLVFLFVGMTLFSEGGTSNVQSLVNSFIAGGAAIVVNFQSKGSDTKTKKKIFLKKAMEYVKRHQGVGEFSFEVNENFSAMLVRAQDFQKKKKDEVAKKTATAVSKSKKKRKGASTAQDRDDDSGPKVTFVNKSPSAVSIHDTRDNVWYNLAGQSAGQSDKPPERDVKCVGGQEFHVYNAQQHLIQTHTIDPHAHEKHTVEIDPQVVEADGDQIRIPAASNEARPSGLRRAQTVVGSVTGRTYSTRDWSKERLCDVVM